MKKIIILLLISILIAFLSSCSKKASVSNSGDPNKVIGTWEAAGIVTLSLNSSYSAQVTYIPMTQQSGTWTFDGGKVTVTTTDLYIYTYNYTDMTLWKS